MVGYVYQCEYALYRALDVDDPAENLMVETFDDVVVEGVDDSLELLQLKHHDPAKAKPFTDTSEDLWKTLRIWASLIADGSIDPTKTKFFLLTTASASASSKLVSYLAPKGTEGFERNIAEAKALLLSIAQQIEGRANQSVNVGPFLALQSSERDALISNITIVPGVAVIEDLRKKILRRLSLTGATSDNLEIFAQSLLGWWYWAVVDTLRSKTRASIPKAKLQERITDLVAQYAVSSLPIFEDLANPDSDEKTSLKSRLFVQQLSAIGHNPDRTTVAGALIDYYRADGHIKRWVRDLRLQPTELNAFRDELHGHWAMSFGAIEPDVEACAGSPEISSELAKLGRKALDASLKGSQAKLKDLSLDYLRRGVLHLMANEPVIGWHPHWASKFGPDK